MRPIVLDFDGSVGRLPGETRIEMADLQEAVRLSCTAGRLAEVAQRVPDPVVSAPMIVFTGSGDFHHVTLPLIRKHAPRAPIDVVVLDNHPDNMRYPWGIHCGSWVTHATRLRCVRRVDVLGITSPDVSARHAWENSLLPLWRGKLAYWCIGVGTAWAARLGMSGSVRSFDSAAAMLQSFASRRDPSGARVYLSIDKDVLSRTVAQTNWDQGVLAEHELHEIVARLAPHCIAIDVTGDVSQYRYRSRWKRLQQRIDPQPYVEGASLAAWQAQHDAVNRRLVDLLAGGQTAGADA